jgi:hypothetical protein
MIAVDPEDLLPAFAARMLQVEVHVRECLVDLGVDIRGDGARRGIPTAFVRKLQIGKKARR